MPFTPEQQARQQIDQMLAAAGWQVQTHQTVDRTAALGVAVCEFPLTTGEADYLLFAQGRPIGVVEAKPAGTPLSGVEPQAIKYCAGLPPMLQPLAWHDPLPFRYASTGVETFFADARDPDARSRRVFSFHRPETLIRWAQSGRTLRARLRQLPPLDPKGLWTAQVEAIQNLELSLAQDRPRALIQMATGSGKTFTAVNFVYRLIKHAGAERVLFMVDRTNLGRQAYNEFSQFITPDDGRKFTELYNVQHTTANVLDPVSKVCVTTVQRLFSMLSDEPELGPELEVRPLARLEHIFGVQPKLEKNAQDTKSGAGQYFTPRPLIRAMVDVMRPEPGITICDPAAGTGGFLIAAHEYITQHHQLNRMQYDHLNHQALHGWEIVDNTARLCVMNLYLRGIGANGGASPIRVDDSLASHPGEYFHMALTNPPLWQKEQRHLRHRGGRVAPRIPDHRA